MSTSKDHGARGFQFPLGPGPILGTTTVSERGQVVIPADARKELNIKAGDRLVVFANRYQGTLMLVKADMFTQVSEFLMAKANKLGRLTADWLDGLDSEDDGGEARDGEAAPGTQDPDTQDEQKPQNPEVNDQG